MEEKLARFRKLLNNPEIIDVLIFGSAVRGKEKPGDLDVCVLWNRKKGRTEGAIDKTYEELFSSDFLAREDILADAISLRLGKRLGEAFGYRSFSMFIYSLEGKDYNERARFHAAMRKITKELGILRFRGIALVPIGVSEKFKEFLNVWKVKYRETRVLFPEQEFEFLKNRKIEESLLIGRL